MTIDSYKAAIQAAAKNKTPIQIRGIGSKDFYGNPCTANQQILDVSSYSGIVEYEPTELVVTARAGTCLTDLQTTLHEQGQMLAFEPPDFGVHIGTSGTLGGCIATGLSGPRRVSTGAARDFVLGTRILDGNGNDLSFGGQVMKNVAGYDVSRLMVGAMGTLGVLLEVSLKVLPLPPAELTLHLPMHEADAINTLNQWAGQPLPISASCFYQDQLFIRLSGAESAIRAAHNKLGGEVLTDSEQFWASVREQTHDFFQSGKSLWRLSIKPTTPPLALPGSQLIEWHGALRWLVCDADVSAETIRQAAQDAGGHATLFRSNESRCAVFHPLDPGMLKIHQALKQKFDPAGILNPGRLYPEF